MPPRRVAHSSIVGCEWAVGDASWHREGVHALVRRDDSQLPAIRAEARGYDAIGQLEAPQFRASGLIQHHQLRIKVPDGKPPVYQVENNAASESVLPARPRSTA